MDITRQANGTIIIESYQGFLKTADAVALVESQFDDVKIHKNTWKISHLRRYEGENCTTAFKFEPREETP